MPRWIYMPAIALIAFGAGSAHAQDKAQAEALVDQVKVSIARGVEYLKQCQRGDGGWEINVTTIPQPGGGTTLALLALLNAGVPADDPAIKNGFKYLRGLDPDTTYMRALQTMVLAELNRPEDLERIQDNVKWLLDARVRDENGVLKGWTYKKLAQAGRPTDNSNSQFALLGLWAGKRSGARIERKTWEEIREFYTRTQRQDGSWSYVLNSSPSLTMTTAGLTSLLITGMELNDGREQLHDDGTASNCGVYQENPAAAKALRWIAGHFQYADDHPGIVEEERRQRVFYNLYGIERVGRLSGLRFLGDHDWYREGCQFLVRAQARDGSWSGTGAFDQWPEVSTSFALLFLSKGRTPVLISKIVHTANFPRDERDTDWNNDRNDLRHLVEFASVELFKKMPLAWQNFDMLRAAGPRKAAAKLGAKEMLGVTSEMLQSPIMYITGHKSPLSRFTKQEKELLKKYVEGGGFILAEACCGKPEFDEGFKALTKELWPDNQLENLPASHPIWTAFYPVPPGQPYTLMGISMGCKTVLVYSPQDLSCQWESSDRKSARGMTAFRLGVNIIAYATGKEPPRPRLTKVDLAGNDDPMTVPRGFFKVAQLKHGGDWKPAPRAMRNLMDYLHKHAGLDVVLKTEELPIASKNVIDFKFVYMHGRGQFTVPADQLKNLRFNIENGGLLFADACCGQTAFDKSFRKFIAELLPKHKLQDVPFDDELYSKELNGVRLDETTIRCRREPRGSMSGVPPALEGIKIDNRWVVLYSKYDIGCALERHTSLDCLGYDPESAAKIASAAVLYLLRPR